MDTRPLVLGSEAATKTLLDASADAYACPVEGKTLAEVAEKKGKACTALLTRALSPKGSAERLLEAGPDAPPLFRLFALSVPAHYHLLPGLTLVHFPAQPAHFSVG